MNENEKPAMSDRVKEPSEEYKNFANGLKSILSVSKKDFDAKLAEQKQAKQTSPKPNEA